MWLFEDDFYDLKKEIFERTLKDWNRKQKIRLELEGAYVWFGRIYTSN